MQAAALDRFCCIVSGEWHMASGTTDVGRLADGLSALSVCMLDRITVTAATLRLADASQHKVLVRTAYSEEENNALSSNHRYGNSQ
jgi:hypothetical protein